MTSPATVAAVPAPADGDALRLLRIAYLALKRAEEGRPNLPLIAAVTGEIERRGLQHFHQPAGAIPQSESA